MPQKYVYLIISLYHFFTKYTLSDNYMKKLVNQIIILNTSNLIN